MSVSSLLAGQLGGIPVSGGSTSASPWSLELPNHTGQKWKELWTNKSEFLFRCEKRVLQRSVVNVLFPLVAESAAGRLLRGVLGSERPHS